MLDGSYRLSLRAPAGVKRGALTLRVRNGRLAGEFLLFGVENPLEGRAEESRFVARGSLMTAVGPVAFTLEATVEDGVLQGTAFTEKGDMPVSGTRLPEPIESRESR